MTKYYLIQCPRCKKQFQRTIQGHPKGKSKVCPQCSKQFIIHHTPDKTNILGVIER